MIRNFIVTLTHSTLVGILRKTGLRQGNSSRSSLRQTTTKLSFNSILADEIRKLGYGIENKPFSFEVQGLGSGNIERFSRRTQEIESLAAELGISGDDKAKDGLAARTRGPKEVGLSGEKVRKEWLARLDRLQLIYQDPQPVKKLSAQQAVDLAVEESFERRSVILHRRLIATALQLSLGQCSRR